MYCSKCGSQNKEGSKFCKACGFSLQHVRQINQNKKQQPNQKFPKSHILIKIIPKNRNLIKQYPICRNNSPCYNSRHKRTQNQNNSLPFRL